MQAALFVSDTPAARAAEAELRARYRFAEPADAKVIVALGGDGFLLALLHRLLDGDVHLPVFGMNRGTVGFLMNDWSPDKLPERLEAARGFALRPLTMTAISQSGATVVSPAFNEVSLLRETRQAARIEIAIDGKVRMPELSCDGVLVATPAGSTAYNLSVNGPILPLESDLVALTAISPFRPRRWHGALLPNRSVVEFRMLEADRRPVSAVADQVEVRDVTHVRVATDFGRALELLFDPEYALDDRIFAEQFLT
ncbi:MAG: NAD kinase [Sphingomonadaceae bacterium]